MTTPDDSDHVLDALSEDDDAFVRELLGSLPPVPMPPDVVARLNAALAAEAAGTQGAVQSGGQSGTVVPLDQARQRRLGPRLLSAAAVLLVLAGGYVVLRGQGTSSPGSSAAGAAPSTYAVEQTGTQYSTVALDQQVRTLVSHQQPSSAGVATPSRTAPADSTAGGSPSPTAAAATESSQPHAAVAEPLNSLLAHPTSFQACLAAVLDGADPTEQPVAVDAGTYDGQPALVVVLPGPTSRTLDVFVVTPLCGVSKDAHVITYHSVTRS